MTDAEFIDALAEAKRKEIRVVRWLNWQPGMVACLDRAAMLDHRTLSAWDLAKLLERNNG